MFWSLFEITVFRLYTCFLFRSMENFSILLATVKDKFYNFKVTFYLWGLLKKPYKMSKVSRDTILESVNQVLELSKAKERKFLETIELQVYSFKLNEL